MHAKYTFESFIPTIENKFAYYSAEAAANAPCIVYNPLILYGPNGTGKTHLLHAIANRIRKMTPEHQVVYSTCDDFLSHMIQALLNKDKDSLESIYLDPDVLLLDDVHHLAGKNSTQEMLLSFFRHRLAANKLTVIASAVPLVDLAVLNSILDTADLHLCASIAAPQAETRLTIARAKADALGLSVTDAPLIYISNHTDNIRQIEGALSRILAYRDLGLLEPTTVNIMKMLSEEWLPTIQKSLD